MHGRKIFIFYLRCLNPNYKIIFLYFNEFKKKEKKMTQEKTGSKTRGKLFNKGGAITTRWPEEWPPLHSSSSGRRRRISATILRPKVYTATATSVFLYALFSCVFFVLGGETMDPMILVWIGIKPALFVSSFCWCPWFDVHFCSFSLICGVARRILIGKQINKKLETLIIIGHGRHCPINISASTDHIDSLLLSRSFFIFMFDSYSSPLLFTPTR